MKSKKIIKGKTYEIRFQGRGRGEVPYRGKGVATGEKIDIDGFCLGFKIPNERDTCFFPEEDVFEV